MSLPDITEFDQVFSKLPKEKQERMRHVKEKRDAQLSRIAEKVRKQNDKFGDFHRLMIARRCFTPEEYEDRKYYNEVREKTRKSMESGDLTWMNDVYKNAPSGKVYTTPEEVPDEVKEPDIIDLDESEFEVKTR